MQEDNNHHLPKVSVVIPMYNCEEFVQGVLSMFSEQTLDDFEVICVIDGATDGTEEEVKKYCKTDDRFRYVVRENGGAGAARNTGIEYAEGEYIVFADADDSYDKDFLKKLYGVAKKSEAQIAVCGAVTYDYLADDKKNMSGFNKSEMIDGEVYSSKYTKHLFRNIDTSNQNKMFLLDFLKKTGIRHSETPATNDLFFSKATLASAERIVVIHDDLVTIRRFINPQSISSHRGVYSHVAVKELNKLYNWLNERGILGTYISDYLWLFDVTLNYEMKNGINTFLAEETVRTLNCDDPWINMNSGQIMQILKNSFDEKSGESIKTIPEGVSSDNAEKIKTYNNIIKNRNKSRTGMQELIKKTSIDRYKRDLDDPNSRSPFYDAGSISIQSSKDPKESDNPQITVVIPMYNCSEYVSEVLSMFADQSFHNFEVICVIDGATDNTVDLVKDFCDKDTRFRYVVRENGGPGAARNTGLDMACGKYIIFADADDEYSPEYLKKLYETAVRYDAQIVVSRFVEKNITINADIIRGFDEKKIHENIVYSHKGIDDLFRFFSSRVTNKLFNLDFVRANGLVFPNIRVSEDAYFSYATLSIAERIVVIYDTLHTYRLHINQKSLSTNRLRFRHESVDSVRLLYQFLKKNFLLDYHKEDFMKRADYVLAYEGGSGATPRFISEFAHMLNAEEPWDKMTSEEILTYLREGLLAKRAVHEETELKNKVDSTIIEKDKELSFLINVYRNRIHTAELIRKVSMEHYGRNLLKPYDIPFENEEEKYDYYINKFMPSKVRLEASTICQLRCAGCGFQKGGEDDLGRGYLTIDNFRRFCEMNPFVRQIELSNYGEIFMNPDLVQIMYEAKDRGVRLTSMNGSNFNTVSDEQMHALVETGFRGITLSIDGASQETYSKYRIRGNFDTVIENVRKLQKLKKDAGTEYPKLRWNFILMEHNELEIGKAKAMAEELGIPIRFKYNWDKTYKPVHRDYIMKETGLTELTEAEYKSAHKLDPFDSLCKEIFLTPQINWDGRMLGCCTRRYATFDVNVFEVGLEAAMKSPRYMQAKECLLTVHPDKEKYGSCTCYECGKRLQREKAGVALGL